MTAWDIDDALNLIASAFAPSNGSPLPPVASVEEDVDVSGLAARRTSHLGNPSWRGVWYPSFNLWVGPDK